MAIAFDSEEKLLERILSDGTVLKVISLNINPYQTKHYLEIKSQNALREISFSNGNLDGYLEVKNGSSYYQPNPQNKLEVLSDFGKIFGQIFVENPKLIHRYRELTPYLEKQQSYIHRLFRKRIQP